jgi:beta-lactamase class A
MRSIDIVWANMEEELKELCALAGAACGEGPSGVMGYSLLDLCTGRRSGFRDTVVFPAASTIKVAVLVTVASRVHAGELSWEQRVAVGASNKAGGDGILSLLKHPVDLSLWDLASLVAALSDNEAANRCIGFAGMDNVNSMLKSLGLRDTCLKRQMMDAGAVKRGDENLTTPADLACLFEKLYRREGIPRQVADDVLELLELPKPSPFTIALPSALRRANKDGSLGHVRLDAGIIYLPGRDFCLSVAGSFMAGDREREVADVVAAAYRYMEVLATCNDLGRSPI